MNYFPNDPDVSSFKGGQQRAEDLMRRVSSGRVASEADLSKLFLDSKTAIHPSMASRLADTGEHIVSRIPSLKTSFGEISKLKETSATYLAKNAGRLKKILPFGLASLIGLAGGANASEIAEGMLPMALSPTTLGCSELYSVYAQPVSEDCKAPSKELTETMKDFLTLDEGAQAKEICRFPSLATNIRQLHQNFFAAAELSCSPQSVTIKKNSKPSYFGSFTFEGQNLTQAQISSSELEGMNGYRIQLAADGTIQNGVFVNGRASIPIKKNSPEDKVANLGNDFAQKQVLAYSGKECCSNSSSPSCGNFRLAPSSGQSSGSEREGSPSQGGAR